MIHATPTDMQVYEVQMINIEGNFTISAEVSKFSKPKLISLPNPCYKDVIQKYSYLKGIQINGNDEKTELLIHIVIGTSKYAKIKTKRNIRIEKIGEQVAKHPAFVWIILSGGRDTTQNHMLLTRSNEADYAELCQLDVLGLGERKNNEKGKIYQELKDELWWDGTKQVLFVKQIAMSYQLTKLAVQRN